MLEEMGLPYALKSIKYDSAYFASDEFRAINPMGKVPALYDDGALIVESTAIDPPWSSTSFLVIASPRPVPPTFRVL